MGSANSLVPPSHDVGNLIGVTWARKDDILDGKKIRDFKGAVRESSCAEGQPLEFTQGLKMATLWKS